MKNPYHAQRSNNSIVFATQKVRGNLLKKLMVSGFAFGKLQVALPSAVTGYKFEEIV